MLDLRWLVQREVGEDEPVALDGHPGLKRNRPREHRAVVRTRVELAPLTAGIDRGWQFGEESFVELASGEPAIDRPGIQARQAGAQSGTNHLARERRRVRAEEGKERC